MDRYLVRTPRLQDSANQRNSPKKKAKQSRIEELAGVVVYKDFQLKKELLERQDTPKEEKLKALKELGEKKPCKEALVKVGIGKTIKSLSKNASDEEVRRGAEAVYLTWKRELERRVEAAEHRIPVQSDLETERLRKTSKKFLLAALTARKIKEADRLAEVAEEEIFIKSKRLVGKNYRRLSRRVIFHLKSLPTTNSEELAPRDIIRIVKSFRQD